MRYVKRLPTPQILAQRGAQWTQDFLGSTKSRPDGSKYAHAQIRSTLDSMSFHKCFYCEQKLKGRPKEIDHHIEVSERRDLAYDWDNLYLACDNCNNKLDNLSIPISQALNPCKDSDADIEIHITFEKDVIRPKNGSAKGLITIQKYKLDTELLDYVRSRQIQKFTDLLLAIYRQQIQEGGRQMTQAEKQSLKCFADPDASFSLMFRILLQELGI
jgi:hypothetical protein